MRKKYLLIGGLAIFQLFTQAQEIKDTRIQKVKKTEIELVYNQYFQDGNNSAVTGGTGTEKLTVYGPALKLKQKKNYKKGKKVKQRNLSLNIGADVISSASTDKIDAVVSSASLLDTRGYLNVEYGGTSLEKNISVYGGMGFSLESDYLSVGTKLGAIKKNKEESQSLSAEFQFFNDDMRWGRLSKGFFNPKTLIYPAELRGTQWNEKYKRYSYNLKLGWTQIINKRNIAAVFPEIAYQAGLLSTPFHRVYFNDGADAPETLGVEQLPDQRLKFGLALKLNTFVGGNLILKNSINSYKDSFGILAIAFENETAIKVNPNFTLSPNVRYYIQNGSDYFKAYKEHDPSEEYFTSDYDLSDIQTYSLGLALKYKLKNSKNKKFHFKTITSRYTYYKRSDGLTSHVLSLIFNMEVAKK